MFQHFQALLIRLTIQVDAPKPFAVATVNEVISDIISHALRGGEKFFSA
jgi:hypothetical protein